MSLYSCLKLNVFQCSIIVKKSQLDAIDFALNSTFMKIFSTRSQEVVEMCKQIFGCHCQAPSHVVVNRKCKFLSKFIVSDNMLCQVFTNALA